MGKKSSKLSVTESLFIGAHSHKDLLLLTVAGGDPCQLRLCILEEAPQTDRKVDKLFISNIRKNSTVGQYF